LPSARSTGPPSTTPQAQCGNRFNFLRLLAYLVRYDSG
jgi:hypothetical protein